MQNAHKNTPQEQYEQAYLIYFAGKQIELEQKKALLANKSGIEGLKNMPNADLKGMMSSKTFTKEHLKDTKNFIKSIRENDTFKIIKETAPGTMKEIIKDSYAQENLVSSINTIKNNFFEGLNEKAIEALTQSSGNFFSSNSESYQKISDDIKDIYSKNASLNGASTEDYLKLYKDCKDYIISHDSLPKTSNGMRRVNAAISMFNKLSLSLSSAMPELENELLRDNAMIMAKSKMYRDMINKTSTKNLQTLAKGHEAELENGFDNLPDELKTKIEKQLKLLGLTKQLDMALKDVPGCQIGSKIEKGDNIKIEKLNNVADDAIAFTNRIFERAKGSPPLLKAYTIPAQKQMQMKIEKGNNMQEKGL